MATKLIAALLTVFIAASITSAQPDDDDGPPKRSREEMIQRVEDIRKMKLMDVLSLQGDQVEKFFGVYNPLQKDVGAKRKNVDDAADAIRKAAKSGADESAMKSNADAMLTAMKALEDAVSKRNTSVRSVLTSRQYAIYLAFEARFHEELLRTILKKSRQR